MPEGSPLHADVVHTGDPHKGGVSVTIVLGGRSPVADLVLDHHRANFRPRVAIAASPAPIPAPPPPRVVSSVRPLTAVIGPGAAVSQVLIIRLIACVVLWATAGTVYGFWQLGNALVPTDRPGEVTCIAPRGVGSIPGC